MGRIVTKEQQDSTSSDNEFFEHLKQARNVKSTDMQGKKVTLRIDDIDVTTEPDTGADVNIMDEHH